MLMKHMTNLLMTCGLLSSLLMPPAIALGSDLTLSRTTTFPLVQTAPVIDGRLDEPIWQQASAITNFLNLERLKKTADESTTVLLLADEQNLYLGFICESHDPAKIIADHGQEHRDALRLYKDDVVELFLDPMRTKDDCYHWIVNVNGAIYDSTNHRLISTEKMIRTPEWNSNAQAAGSRGDKAWFVELRIPLSDLRPEEQVAIKAGRPFGLQFARENRTTPDITTQLSTWSACYLFSEPMEFGSATVGGQSLKETATTWQQKIAADVFLAEKPTRPTYHFTRVFDFGLADAASANYPQADTQTITADAIYKTGETAGFTQASQPTAYTAPNQGKRYYGSQLSPLAADYLESRQAATFSFDLPAGDYEAILVVGKDYRTSMNGIAPVRVRLSAGQSSLIAENLIPARTFSKHRLPFTSVHNQPVEIQLEPEQGTAWAIKYVLVYPASEVSQALAAADWLERDEFNYPFEEWISQAKLWVDHPPATSPIFLPSEQRNGFALVNVPSAQYVPRNWSPATQQGRGSLDDITAPGQHLAMQMAFHAIAPQHSLRVELESADEGLTVTLMQTRYKYEPIGRGTLNQMGRTPNLLWQSSPVQLSAGQTQPYWLLVDVSPHQKPGVYQGAVAFYDGQNKIATRSFRLAVLPDVLSADAVQRSVYFTSPSSAYGQAPWSTLTSQEKSLIALDTKRQLQDLRRHGVSWVNTPGAASSYKKSTQGQWVYQPTDQEQIYFDLLKQTGVKELATFILGFDAYSPGPFILNEDLKAHGFEPLANISDRYKVDGKVSDELIATLTELTRQNIALRQQQGLHVPAFEIWDEPGHLHSKAMVPFLNAVRQGGGRTASTVISGAFPALSGQLDSKIYAMVGQVGGEAESPQDIAAHQQSEGSKYYAYHNAILMGRDPRIPRLTQAYWASAWNLDGLTSWKYFKINGDVQLKPSHHPLMFDASGNLLSSTPNWEAVAQGIFDSRLEQTLQTLASGDGPRKEQARAFLTQLRNSMSGTTLAALMGGFSSLSGGIVVDQNNWSAAQFDYLRARLAEQVLTLSGEPEVQALNDLVQTIRNDAAARVKDELAIATVAKDQPEKLTRMFVNGSFEEGGKDQWGNMKVPDFTRWSRNALLDDTVAHTGKRSLKFTHQDHKQIDVVVSRFLPLEQGQTYRLDGWARRDADAQGIDAATGIWMQTYADKDAAAYARRVQLRFPVSKPSFEWTKFTHTFTAQADESILDVRIFNNDPTSIIHIDDLQITQIKGLAADDLLY